MFNIEYLNSLKKFCGKWHITNIYFLLSLDDQTMENSLCQKSRASKGILTVVVHSRVAVNDHLFNCIASIKLRSDIFQVFRLKHNITIDSCAESVNFNRSHSSAMTVYTNIIRDPDNINIH